MLPSTTRRGERSTLPGRGDWASMPLGTPGFVRAMRAGGDLEYQKRTKRRAVTAPIRPITRLALGLFRGRGSAPCAAGFPPLESDAPHFIQKLALVGSGAPHLRQGSTAISMPRNRVQPRASSAHVDPLSAEQHIPWGPEGNEACAFPPSSHLYR
jgi:hypothetical protein